MKTNVHWEVNEGCYDLHFDKFGEDVIVLTFAKDNDIPNCYNYKSEDLKVEDDYEYADTLEEIKEIFELMYEEHLQDEINYYECLLNMWNEE